jgi:hypothetical protein
MVTGNRNAQLHTIVPWADCCFSLNPICRSAARLCGQKYRQEAAAILEPVRSARAQLRIAQFQLSSHRGTPIVSGEFLSEFLANQDKKNSDANQRRNQSTDD